jgi:dihydrofolate reductase
VRHGSLTESASQHEARLVTTIEALERPTGNAWEALGWQRLGPARERNNSNNSGLSEQFLSSLPLPENHNVVSSTLKAGEWNNTTVIKGGVVEEITKLKNEAGKDLLIMGSATLLQSLMAADLIDEYWFLVQPIVMGRGKRVFKDSAGPSRLKLVRTTTLGLGVVGLCYRAEPTPARRE